MGPAEVELSRRDRIEFVAACLSCTIVATPIASAFLYHAITDRKSGWTGPLIITAIAALMVGLWAAKARPGQRLAFGMIVLLPILVSIGLIGIKVAMLFG